MVGLKGYIALTDWEWYSYLHSCLRVDEANFWQPHGNRIFRRLKSGEPFFFKLRAPRRAIAGFGFFERYESLPAWLAWDCFGAMNGAPDFETMIDRIVRLRGDDTQSARMGDFQIGCIMVSAPVFFAEEDWVLPPANWAKTGIQQGKTYELNTGEGLRILDECLQRAQTQERYWNVEHSPQVVADGSPRHGSPILVRPRMGQGLFSFAVRDAYGHACAVSREHSEPVLEAAHIVPYEQGGKHRVDNGILLRRDLHRLFDRGYATVTPDYEFRVGDSLRDEYKNGRSYYCFDKMTIEVPGTSSLQPNRDYLEWHGERVFRG